MATLQIVSKAPIDVRDHPIALSQDERKRDSADEFGDAVQAGSIGVEEMEMTAKLREDVVCHRRTVLPRQNTAERKRRLIQNLKTQDLTIALAGVSAESSMMNLSLLEIRWN
ncbi:MAG TPA: hypothetical protein VLA12_18570, partial [Planctomycetaceae bacterium]|nr:hypothetical protein [Planctomycetaceae bacterium]